MKTIIPAKLDCPFCGGLQKRGQGNYSYESVSIIYCCTKCGAVSVHKWLRNKKITSAMLEIVKTEDLKKDGNDD